jgi:hypothetical protein
LAHQAEFGIEYLKRNPPVLDMMMHTQLGAQLDSKLKILAGMVMVAKERSIRGPSTLDCHNEWSVAKDWWFRVDQPTPRGDGMLVFEYFTAAIDGVVTTVRSDFKSEEAEYQDLMSFNDRYSGIERLERAQAAYIDAFENDDVAGMIRKRALVLGELANARSRKQLLEDQGRQLDAFEQRLNQLKTLLDDAEIKRLSGPEASRALNDIGAEIGSLSGMKAAQRGDIAKSLEGIDRKLKGASSIVEAARSRKQLLEDQGRQLDAFEQRLNQLKTLLDDAEIKRLSGPEASRALNDIGAEIGSLSGMKATQRGDIAKSLEGIDRKFVDVSSIVATAEAKLGRLKTIDERRRHLISDIQKVLANYATRDLKNRLSTAGNGAMRRLEAKRLELSAVENVPLVDRPDLEKVLSEVEGDVTALQQFKDVIVQIDGLSANLSSLENKVTARGRRLLNDASNTELTEIEGVVRALVVARGPLAPEQSQQITITKEKIAELASSIDSIMDNSERLVLADSFPFRSGDWTMMYVVDKITDEKSAQALMTVEGSQAKYQVTLSCRESGLEFLVAAFEKNSDQGKIIPWEIFLARQVRVRFDSNLAFNAVLQRHGYGNVGQIGAATFTSQFKDILNSGRMVIGDIFPGEQLEIVTRLPEKFRRICILLYNH